MGPSRALALVAAAACLAPSVSKTRPNLGKGPVVIACLPSINHVFALNEAEQEMHVSVNLDCYWNDTRLGGTDRTRMDPGEIWLPDLEALSQIEPPQEVRVESAFVDHGRVHFRTRKNLKVSRGPALIAVLLLALSLSLPDVCALPRHRFIRYTKSSICASTPSTGTPSRSSSRTWRTAPRT